MRNKQPRGLLTCSGLNHYFIQRNFCVPCCMRFLTAYLFRLSAYWIQSVLRYETFLNMTSDFISFRCPRFFHGQSVYFALCLSYVLFQPCNHRLFIHDSQIHIKKELTEIKKTSIWIAQLELCIKILLFHSVSMQWSLRVRSAVSARNETAAFRKRVCLHFRNTYIHMRHRAAN